MKSGTIFDNILITDDEDYAEKQGNEVWKVTSVGEKKMKEQQDEEERKAREAAGEDEEDDEGEDFDMDDMDMDFGDVRRKFLSCSFDML